MTIATRKRTEKVVIARNVDAAYEVRVQSATGDSVFDSYAMVGDARTAAVEVAGDLGYSTVEDLTAAIPTTITVSRFIKTRVTLDLASELDEAGVALAVVDGADEVDEVQPVGTYKVLNWVLASEATTAQAMHYGNRFSISTAAATDTARPLVFVKPLVNEISPVSETAEALLHFGHLVTLTRGTETAAARPLAFAKAIHGFGVAAETDRALQKAGSPDFPPPFHW